MGFEKNAHVWKKKVREWHQKLIPRIQIRWGTLSPAFYEIGWLITLSDQNGKPSWRKWINWLVQMQDGSGSWGYASEGVKARFLTTFQIFSALNALNKKTESVSKVLNKARNWLETHQRDLPADWQDPIGYELLLPSQIQRAESVNLDISIDSTHIRTLQASLERKIAFFQDQAFTPRSTIAHSCEFFGSDISTTRLEQMQSLNESLGNSPSATAYFLGRNDLDPQSRRIARRYLDFVQYENNHLVKIFPLDLVEVMGVLLYLSYDPTFQLRNWHQVLERLLSPVQQQGWVSAASTYPVIDLDDMLSALVELLEEKGVLKYEEWERKIRRDILRKTENLIKENVELLHIADNLPLYEINKDIASTIEADKISQRVKIASLYKSIKVHIENKRKESPYLVSIGEKVEEIISQLRERQRSVESALEELTRIAEDIAKAEEEQKKSGLDKEEFSYFWILRRHGVKNPEKISKDISNIIAEKEHWIFNENVERELRKELYKILGYSTDVVKLVNELVGIARIIRGET